MVVVALRAAGAAGGGATVVGSVRTFATTGVVGEGAGHAWSGGSGWLRSNARGSSMSKSVTMAPSSNSNA
jgi:hypothetical protein